MGGAGGVVALWDREAERICEASERVVCGRGRDANDSGAAADT